ncbi:hypothetical protein ACS0TY_023624 [Phlomoides rotata]
MLTMLLNRRRYRSHFNVADVQRLVRYRMVDRIPQQLEHLNELTQLSDVDCFNNLRMNCDTFNRFCYLLRHSGGLVDGRYVSVGEQVAIFLSVLSHHSMVRVVKFCFKRSSHTVHQHFHNVLRVILNLHGSLLASPTPVDDECTHPRWKNFKRDLNARHMRHKSWPLYADWCEIFGQSRATGGLMLRMSVKVKLRDGKNYKQWSEMQVALTSDPFVDVVHNFCNTTSDRLGEIAQRIGHDQDMSTARKSIYSSVSKMDTLTLQEKLRATALIARHAEDIDVFFSLPDDDRKE